MIIIMTTNMNYKCIHCFNLIPQNHYFTTNYLVKTSNTADNQMVTAIAPGSGLVNLSWLT